MEQQNLLSGARIQQLMSTPQVNCTRCLHVIEVIFQLMTTLRNIEAENTPESNILKHKATIRAMHNICCAITQLRTSPQEE